MKIGFIGLGNVGGKLAGSLLRNGFDLTVRDLDDALVQSFVDRGATSAASPKEMAEKVDLIITCLPSPTVCSTVMESEDGIIAGLSEGKIWLEMSTTDASEVMRLANIVEAKGAMAMDCPVSGGCHRAATGNISIFAGGKREAFERVLPILTTMGRRILHTGPIGSASVLKVVTNYLCSVHLAALAEAFAVAKKAGMDMNTTYEAIRISSGNSFVHETESQVILNGSRDINFTMDLVVKDVGLFGKLANVNKVPVEISPLVLNIFKDGQDRFGPREFSPNIIKRLEEACNIQILGMGFPAEMTDDEPEEPGYEEAVNIAKKIAEENIVGDPNDSSVTMGPMASTSQKQTVLNYIKTGIAEGARLVTGGIEMPPGLHLGAYVKPTIFADVSNEMVIAREEIFGPVLCIIVYDDIEAAIEMANDTVFGLASAVYARDKAGALKIARRIRAGQCYIQGSYFSLEAPFGGYKQSGNGREWGDQAMHEYIETKAVIA